MNQMLQFVVQHGPILLFGVVFVEQLGVPLPATPWLLAAGALGASLPLPHNIFIARFVVSRFVSRVRIK